jgi:hypothetical protein
MNQNGGLRDRDECPLKIFIYIHAFTGLSAVSASGLRNRRGVDDRKIVLITIEMAAEALVEQCKFWTMA